MTSDIRAHQIDGEEGRAESDALPCCNWIESADDLSGWPCAGTMRRGWPEYVCDTCRGRCGALAHPTHPATERTEP